MVDAMRGASPGRHGTQAGAHDLAAVLAAA